MPCGRTRGQGGRFDSSDEDFAHGRMREFPGNAGRPEIKSQHLRIEEMEPVKYPRALRLGTTAGSGDCDTGLVVIDSLIGLPPFMSGETDLTMQMPEMIHFLF